MPRSKDELDVLLLHHIKREIEKDAPNWPRLQTRFPHVSRATFYRRMKKVADEWKNEPVPRELDIGEDLESWVHREFPTVNVLNEKMLNRHERMISEIEHIRRQAIAEDGSLKSPVLLIKAIELESKLFSQRHKLGDWVMARRELHIVMVTLVPTLGQQTDPKFHEAKQSLMKLASLLGVASGGYR